MNDEDRPRPADTASDDEKLDFLKEQYSPLTRKFKQYSRNNQLIVPIIATGLVLFLLVALALPFRNKIFERFYPKPRSQAAVCSGSYNVPANRSGFVFTGGDLQQAISDLKTPLYYTYDLNLGPQRSVYVIGKYAQNQADPLGLKLLMENNLSNGDFKGLAGKAPAGWNISSTQDGNVFIDRVLENTMSGGTSIKVANNKSSSTQLTQSFKKTVSAGQIVVFGVWVKTATPGNVRVTIQNSQAPNEDFGVANTKIEPNSWNFVYGYGKVPAGVTNFQLSFKVTGGGNTALFSGAATTVLGSDQNQTMADLVLQRCGSAWMIDDAPGWEQSVSTPFMKPLSADMYALIYYQFYTLIKSADPAAKVLPGGLMGAPIIFDSKDGYSPQTFLDNFRTAYKGFFNSEPPIDALAIRYLATDSNRWSGSTDLESYLSKLRNYMNQVPEWKDKPIWLSRLGVSASAPNDGVDFIKNAIKFLVSNSLNVEKWFWYDSCGFNTQLLSLFASNNKICSWPMKLTALGQAYVLVSATPTPTPTATATPQQTATPSATVAPNPTPTPTNSVSTSSGTLNNNTSTSGGTLR